METRMRMKQVWIVGVEMGGIDGAGAGGGGGDEEIPLVTLTLMFISRLMMVQNQIGSWKILDGVGLWDDRSWN